MRVFRGAVKIDNTAIFAFRQNRPHKKSPNESHPTIMVADIVECALLVLLLEQDLVDY